MFNHYMALLLDTALFLLYESPFFMLDHILRNMRVLIIFFVDADFKKPCYDLPSKSTKYFVATTALFGSRHGIP